MNAKTRHPATELLDQLHAGLLDEQTALKTQLETHLQQCEACRQSASWEHIADHTVLPGQLDQRLESITRNAIRQAPRPARRWVPVTAAASVIALLSATLLFNQTELNRDENHTQQATAAPASIYEDLDFYLWMADHGSDGGQT